MSFFKNFFAGHGKGTKPASEPPPTDEDFREAGERLRTAVEASPHKATSDISTMATSLYELYSRRGEYLKAQGDSIGFVFNTVQGLGIYTMAAQSFYHTGWTNKGIEALKSGLHYANEALSLAPSNPHCVSINKERQELEDLLKSFEQVQSAAETEAIQICTALREEGVQAINNGHEVWRMRGLKPYVLALSDAISELTYCILSPGDFGPYADLLKQDGEVFGELASFLGYYLAIHTLPQGKDAKQKSDTIMPIIATIWRPTERVHGMIDRYHDLMRDPQEMKNRHILWAHRNSDDDQARGVVYEFIINELINGPNLGGELEDPKRLDPADSFYLKLYLDNALIERIKSIRVIAANL